MAFESWTNPEVITAICTGIGTIIGCIALAIKKYKGKPWKEILFNLFTKELKDIEKTIKEVSDNVKDIKKSSNEKKLS